MKNNHLIISIKFSVLLCVFLLSNCKGTSKIIDVYKEDTSFKVVGYLSTYSFYKINSIDFSRTTHVNISFGNLNSDGLIKINGNANITPVIEQLRALDIKVLLSLGGGGVKGEIADNWITHLSNEKRNKTISRIVSFVESNNLDGIDVDIEGQLITHLGSKYNSFVQELKIALHAKGKAITAALNATRLDATITQTTLESFDFINVMAYDATGPWNLNNPGPHSPYELAQESINFWLNTKGISREKIVLGVPFYGYDFDPSHENGGTTFSQIVNNNPADAYVDQVDQLYYNGIPTIIKKTALALEQVNGIMIWELGQDVYTEMSLLKAINQVLEAGLCAGKSISTYYADEDGDGYGNLNKPFQACDQPYGYVDNRDDSDDTDSNIHP